MIISKKKKFDLLTRLTILLLFQFLCFLALIIKFYYLQIIDYDKYLVFSDKNRFKQKYIINERSNIFDRNDIQLTKNYKYYEYKKDKIEWNEFVYEISNDFNNEKDYEENYDRYYIYPTTFAHIIGYTGIKNLKDKNISNFKYGKIGIEKKYDKELSGELGYLLYEVNSSSKPIRLITEVMPISGKNIKLTLDLKLQKYVETVMKNINGSVVVMNPNTGEILSMFSSPSYDSNKFTKRITQEEWDELLNNYSKPLINKTINSRYPPGSTFKLITAIAGLETGWNENEIIHCSGSIALDEIKVLHCWNRRGHGHLTLSDAIKHSCNIYFTKMGLSVGVNNISKYATKFGLGEDFNLEISNNVKGIVPTKEWKKKKFKQNWLVGDTANISIGQGYLAFTPLELAVMVSRIANDGYPIKPFLLYDSETKIENEKLFSQTPIVKQNTLNIVKKGMYRVLNEIGGTAYNFRIKHKNYKMAGKTGTAQIISRETKEGLKVKNKRLDNHALFVGFAPFNNPKYAISVVVENGLSGSLAAVPIARDILLYAQQNKIGYENK